ncbi:MAG: pyruvate dehydrogenase (acetyl-transferring) E1 component subunit alpha [Candidatus Aenigmatarchaeota archaeon]|nr:pyruvate dehydrogenase (acetyl-transferring) E1 component subunit alpha [Candidatus Aenigmarchaeota archaeon]
MPKREVKPKLEMFQILNEDGKIVNTREMPQLKNEDIKRMYELMVLSRVFDDVALKLQREGRILTYASLLGQEASQIGSVLALQKDDWIVPSFRENGVFITLGFPMEGLYQYWAGDERGMKILEGRNALPVAIPVGTQVPHAVGIAWAMKLQGRKNVVVTYFGDGATSKGDFHEGMNFAGVFKVPCVFICQNNQWAISVPRSRQTASETLAQKAFAYGFDGILVDGNDVFAVFKVTKDAVEKARAGKGPTFIECYTYRMENHTTADDWKRYRDPREVEEWKKKDPIDRLKKYMEGEGIWSEDYEKEVWDSAKAKVNEAVKKFESVPPLMPLDMFEYVYAELPPELEEQRKDFE